MGRKEGFLIGTGIFIIIMFGFAGFASFLTADDVETTMNISYDNTPPILLQPIPNQTIAKNTNLTDAFDLDDYFSDNETLTYTASAVENITILINSTTNFVSFYPDYNFTGVRNVTFTAYDIFNESTTSNIVFINVTNDSEPPQWSNLWKDSDSISQNQYVYFYANWTDNVALGYYIFSINQGSGWVNYTQTDFSGKQNTSSYRIQISAPGGTTVYWRFYGFDSSGNMNVTSAQSFVVTQTSVPPSSSTTEEEADTGGTQKKTAAEIETDFEILPPSFKIEIKQGSSTTITIKITNTGNKNLSFSIEIEGLEEFKKTISADKFNISSGKSKTVTIEFDADKRLFPDIYYGKIKIKASGMLKTVPIVIIVKSIETVFDINVSVLEKYKSVKPGQIVKANIIITNMKDIEKRQLSLYYAITDFYGKILDSKKESFLFSSKSVSFEKNLSVPAKTKKGEYLFIARVVSEEITAIDSDIFRVEERFNVAGFVKSNLIFILVVFFSVIASIFAIRYHQNKERLRMLNLYLMITEMKKLLARKDFDGALDIYIRIKAAYGEPIADTALKNKEELKKEMEELSKKVSVLFAEKTSEETKKQEANKEEAKTKTDESEKKPPKDVGKETDNKDSEDKKTENKQDEKQKDDKD